MIAYDLDRPVTHAHGQHGMHEHTGRDYAAHQRPIDDERIPEVVPPTPEKEESSMTTARPLPLACPVIGVDPGPIPGVVVIRPGPPIDTAIFQCDAASVLWLVVALVNVADDNDQNVILAVEKFVVGMRSARSSTPGAGQLTRDMVGKLAALQSYFPTGVQVVQRSASEVFPWASDARLSRVGLYAATKGMQHARSAARHALYAAVRDAGMPDPLSTTKVYVP